MNLSTFVQGWFSLPAVHWTIVPGRSSTLHVNRQPQDINTGSPQLQHHRPILNKLIREGSKKNTQPTKNYLDKMRKKAAPQSVNRRIPILENTVLAIFQYWDFPRDPPSQWGSPSYWDTKFKHITHMQSTPHCKRWAGIQLSLLVEDTCWSYCGFKKNFKDGLGIEYLLR